MPTWTFERSINSQQHLYYLCPSFVFSCLIFGIFFLVYEGHAGLGDSLKAPTVHDGTSSKQKQVA